MAWTLVSPNGTASGGGGSGAGISVTKPAGVLDNQLLVAVGYLDTDSRTWTAPAGWNTDPSYIATNPGASAVGHQTQVFWKIASSEPASWTWTPSTSGFRNVVVAAFTGGTGAPTMVDLAGTAGQGDSLLVTAQTAPSVTTTVANDLVIFAYSNQSGNDVTGPIGFATNLALSNLGTCIGYATNATASATGTTRPDAVNIGTDNYAALHVAFLLTGTGGGPANPSGPGAYSTLGMNLA